VWLRDDMGLRQITEHAGVDRKTVRRCVEAGEAAGLVRDVWR
jgi:DNA-binding transcriptional regulator LsrR (DeoR family)